MRLLITLLLALAWVGPVFGNETRTAPPGALPPRAEVADLAWLAGAWEGEGISGRATEIYSAPMGGQIAGHFVQTGNGSVSFFEIISIAQVGSSIEYRLKHFNSDLTGWEEKSEVRRFPLVAVDRDTWYFDGLTIRREGRGGMVAAVKVKGGDGVVTEHVFRYRRVR